MDGPTAWGVNARLALDPDVYVVGDQLYRPGSTDPLEEYSDSPRVIVVPTFDPTEPYNPHHSSDREFTISGFGYFFLEDGPEHGFYNPTEQLEIMGRWLFFAPGDGPGGSTFTRYLRLVE
jgi:hypothetical protein